MGDVTKARYFLKSCGSDLHTRETFQSMYAAAEERYRNIQLKKRTNAVLPGELDNKELQAAIEMSVLRYLKKYGSLPRDVANVLHPSFTDEQKLDLVKAWFNA